METRPLGGWDDRHRRARHLFVRKVRSQDREHVADHPLSRNALRQVPPVRVTHPLSHRHRPHPHRHAPARGTLLAQRLPPARLRHPRPPSLPRRIRLAPCRPPPPNPPGSVPPAPPFLSPRIDTDFHGFFCSCAPSVASLSIVPERFCSYVLLFFCLKEYVSLLLCLLSSVLMFLCLK